MHDDIKSIILAVLAVGAVVGLMATGAAATETATPTATPTTDELANQTLDVNDDTEGLRVLAENTTGELSVTVYGIDADGNETQVTTGTLNATSGPNATDTYEYRDVNASAYPEYRVTVTGDAVETLDVTKLQVVEPGGGGLISGVNVGCNSVVGAVILLALIGAGAVANRRR